jgi:hypothetical protein
MKVSSAPILCALLWGASLVSGCSPKPPVLPYLTVGAYAYFPNGCGYDWNGRSVALSDVPRLAREWDGPREVLMVFRFEPVPARCFNGARAIYRALGFTRVYIVSMPQPQIGDPPLLP